MRNVLIVLLTATTVFLADRLVRIENQRYALMVGSCPNTPILDFECLKTVQMRTSWGWHLYYAVTGPVPPVPLFQ